MENSGTCSMQGLDEVVCIPNVVVVVVWFTASDDVVEVLRDVPLELVRRAFDHLGS